MGMHTDGSRPVVDTGREGGAKQAFKDEADINNIIERYKSTGLVEHLSSGVPHFADVSEIGDYRSAVQAVKDAEAHFMELPAAVREAFDNDAATYVDWLSDPDNDARKLEALGLQLLDEDEDNDEAAKKAADPDSQPRGADGRFESEDES